VFRDHPGIAELMPYTGPVPGGVELRYDWVAPPKRALAEHMGECVGLSGIDTEIWLPSWGASPAIQEHLKDRPSPWAILQPKASAWTPNKQWPIDRWQELARRLAKQMTVFEVGADGSAVLGDAAVDLTGATDTRDFAALVGMAEVFVGPPSGGMHLANARKTPSVIVFGGYERASGYAYSNVIGMEGSVPCAPCWLTTPCTVGLGCLTGISVDAVEAAVLKQASAKGTHATGVNQRG
jgi:ADP-heptose:LPS heptosyltransferase